MAAILLTALSPRFRWFTAALVAALLLPALAMSMGNDPRQWINRMHIAVDTMSYQGTLVRLRQTEDSVEAGPQTETFRIYHRSVDGETVERLVGMDGEGFEVIRNDSETVCIFPAQRALLVEKRADGPKSPLAAGLPAYSETMEGHYRFSVVADDRVAGRNAKVLQIAAGDNYRYGYRIWLDVLTAMPLKSQLRTADGQQLLEEVMFADISLQGEVPEDLIRSAYDTSGYAQLMPEDGQVVEASAAGIAWEAGELPPGFVLSAIRNEMSKGSAEPRLHFIYTDGLASVSVFIDSPEPDQPEGAETMGATHAYTVMTDNHMVTAIGQVPAETARRIALTMRNKL